MALDVGIDFQTKFFQSEEGQSILNYQRAALARHVIRLLTDISGDIVLFGGYLRKSMQSNIITDMYDLDFILPNGEMLTTIEKALHDKYKCDFLKSDYNGRPITRAKIFPKTTLFGPTVRMFIDFLVIDSNSVFFPDFDVNMLGMKLSTGKLQVLELYEVENNTDGYGCLDILQCRTVCLESILVNIARKQCNMMVTSPRNFSGDDYLHYINTLFRHRLMKMLKEGWTILNLANTKCPQCEVVIDFNQNSQYSWTACAISVKCLGCSHDIPIIEGFFISI